MWNYRTQYQSCHCWISGPVCGPYGGIYSMFTIKELDLYTRNIYGSIISEYMLIKSRCRTFQENSVICPLHRYLLCEGYVPDSYCTYHYCYSTTDLMQMGVQAALLIRNVPVLGYICNRHRANYEEQMRRQNWQPFAYPGTGWSNIWDCFFMTPTTNTEGTSSENSLATVANQHGCDDRSSSYKLENEMSRSTAKNVDPSNSSPVENGTKTNEIHLTLCAKQDENSLEQDTHTNQQDQQNVSTLADDFRVMHVTETNQGHQRRKLIKQSLPSKSSPVEPMETHRCIRIKICASPSTSGKWHAAPVLDTDTFATLKDTIIKTFGLNHCFRHLSLLYASSYSDTIDWKTLEKEEESRTLIEYSFNDDFIVTCTSSKYPETMSAYAPRDVKQLDCIASQHNVYPLPGLKNLGNTCFMNSALQCLNHVDSFFNYFRSTKIKTLLDNESIVKEKNSILTRLYSKLIESFCSPHDGAVIPREFQMGFGKLAPRFFNYHQHDSLEFLNILLDILHEDLLQILPEKHTIVSKTFHGQIRTVVTCQTCNQNLTTDDSFSFLPLPIPEEDKNATSSGTRGYKLDQCFEAFLQGEHVENYGQWYCEHCGKLTRARKNLSLCELPPVLILQLKRFNYDLRSYTKIDTSIEYDLDNLDINEYVVESHRDTSIRYNLIAVSNHWGNLSGGHFVTYAKLPGTQDWYRYDDNRVGKMDKSIHVNNYSAYILVYQQAQSESVIGTAV